MSVTGDRLTRWLRSGKNPSTLEHAARTAVAAVLSLGVARGLGLPEAHWAPISAMVVMQSSWGASLPISAQRFLGTVFGALVGAVVARYFPASLVAFGVGVLAIGVLCAVARVEQAAYRYACITLAIVLLVPPTASAWAPAVHRCAEVSLGIVVGLAVAAVWTERRRQGPGGGAAEREEAPANRGVG